MKFTKRPLIAQEGEHRLQSRSRLSTGDGSFLQQLLKIGVLRSSGLSFLGCFGISEKKKPLEKTIQTSTKQKTSLLSWPMFRFSVRKSRTKTVPVDNIEKAEADSKSNTSKLIKKKSDFKSSSKPQSPTNHIPSRQNSKADQQLASSNQAARDRPKEVSIEELKS